MFQCIGKRFEGRQMVQCTKTSETPSISPVTKKPTTQYLCHECANFRVPKRGFVIDLPDLDKPNQIEPEEPGDLPEDGYARLEEIDRDDFGDLQEIDL